MKRFALGLLLGVLLTTGIGVASSGGEWGQAPMQAKVGTHLFREGSCRDWRHMTPVQMFSGNSAQYVCKRRFKPPTPP